jgi:hypothetical protein
MCNRFSTALQKRGQPGAQTSCMSERNERLRLIQRLSAEERRWQPDPDDWLKEHDMTDDTSKTGLDRELIALDEPHEVRSWTESLGCTEEQLRDAVNAVGHSADAVRQHLKLRDAATGKKSRP